MELDLTLCYVTERPFNQLCATGLVDPNVDWLHNMVADNPETNFFWVTMTTDIW